MRRNRGSMSIRLFRPSTDCSDSRPMSRGTPTGNIYVSDGYINSRVAKYNSNGDWVKSWGERGPAPGQFNLPHAIVVDRNNQIYVGDRSNRRIQVFDTEGKFIRMFTIDVPAATRVAAGQRQHADRATPGGGHRSSQLDLHHARSESGSLRRRKHVPGRLFKVSLEGKVLGVIGSSGRQLGQFSGVHQLACPSENEVYAAETSNWRVQKLLLRPQPATATAQR